ncbi:hypothetical protein HC864_05140 [Candidatus Gracilibacteria bacterium]|nr:hypothetical protein [Candidatus Gracilibacteria bacterium]
MKPQEIIREYAQRFWVGPSKHFDVFFTKYEDDWLEKIPYLHTIESFCVRLQKAIESKEKICIYSDYDTDAITATGVMYWGLIELGVKKENLAFYVPDRFTEGYGMNTDAAGELASKFDLIISVDCGVNSTKEAEIIAKAGKDLIITDHHQLIGNIPQAVAVINPQIFQVYGGQKEFEKVWSKNKNRFIRDFVVSIDDEKRYLSPSVTGVGVAWFCILWLAYYLRMSGKSVNVNSLQPLLSLVAIGTIADCQSIVEPTNRLLVKIGIRIMQNNLSGIVGLQKLIEMTGLDAKIKEGYCLTSQDLGFVLSPILNSSGRMNHAQLSIRALLSTNQEEAQILVKDLIETNQQRKQLVRDILDQVEVEATEQFDSGSNIIWLEGSWSKGIIGLLASRIVNEFDLPVIVISNQNQEEIIASMRAPAGYDFPKAILAISEITKGGGHAQAAGFSAKKDDSKIIHKRFEKILTQQKKLIQNQKKNQTKSTLPDEMSKEQFKKDLIILEQKDMSNHLLDLLWQLDPFGIDFPLPNFGWEVEVSKVFWMGDKNQHLKILMTNGVNLLMFGLDEKEQNQIKEYFDSQDKSLWVIAKPSKNTWKGKVSNDLIVDKYYILAK